MDPVDGWFNTLTSGSFLGLPGLVGLASAAVVGNPPQRVQNTRISP